MGIVLSVLKPPHHPDKNLLDALPSGIGRVIDVEPRLVSPRFDTLLVTSRGLVVHDHRTGDFHGMPWAHFSVDDHLHHHSRHAVLTMWIGDRRPVELAITRRLALNIVSVAPVLRQRTGVMIDDVVLADHRPSEKIDLRFIDGSSSIETRSSGIPSFDAGSAVDNVGLRTRLVDRRRPMKAAAVAMVLVLALIVGIVGAQLVNGDGAMLAKTPMLMSESADFD